MNIVYHTIPVGMEKATVVRHIQISFGSNCCIWPPWSNQCLQYCIEESIVFNIDYLINRHRDQNRTSLCISLSRAPARTNLVDTDETGYIRIAKTEPCLWRVIPIPLLWPCRSRRKSYALNDEDRDLIPMLYFSLSPSESFSPRPEEPGTLPDTLP